MATDFVTKRPHKKSRGGCITCKTRKVKCNEAHPICQFCEKRNLSCVYPPKPSSRSSTLSSPSSSSPSSLNPSRDPSPSSDVTYESLDVPCKLITAPTSPIITSSGNLSIRDLRLLHQWSTSTASNVGIGSSARDTLLLAVPQLAFENDFLLNAILGISSLQVQRQSPGSEIVRKETDEYRLKALRGFRQALSSLKPGSNLYEAALIMSILLVVLNSKDCGYEEGELLVVNWLTLYRGLNVIMTMEEPEFVKSLSVWPIFQRDFTKLEIPPVIPRILVELFQGVNASDPDYPMLEHWCRLLDALGLLYGSLKQDGLSPALYIRIVAWPSYTTQEFTKSAQERRPRVLIVLTYYLSFLKLIKGLWWVEGMADREIQTIANGLDPIWLPYMEVPLQVSTMNDVEDIAKLLLR